MLIEHRSNQVTERLAAVNPAMPASQKVTREPPFHGMRAEQLHEATVRSQLATVRVFREVLAEPHLLGDFIESLELVGFRLVWPENPEILHVLPHDFAEKVPEGRDVAGQGRAGFLDVNGSLAKIGHLQGLPY